jgi:soluble lytic murein transglycosylase-like protein
MAEVDAIARPRDAKPYAELLTRWRRARRLFFNIATRLEVDAAPGGKPVQEAIRYLATIADWSSAKMRDAPTAAIPKAWQQHVLDAEGRVADPRAYVFAIIDAWRVAAEQPLNASTPQIRMLPIPAPTPR